MKTTAMPNTENYYIPTLLLLPGISNQESCLLTALAEKNTSIYQSIYLNIYEYIKLNQDDSGVSIEAVRTLQNTLTYSTRAEGIRAVCIFKLDTASLPAQNALLKLLEEPPARTKIWLTAQSTAPILPTLLSRCEVISPLLSAAESTAEDVPTELILSLPKLSHRELIDTAATYTERADAARFLEQILTVWHPLLTNSKQQALAQSVLKNATTAHTLVQKNVNTKLVLEHAFFEIKKSAS